MHITRVELENIKSHTSSVFDFGRGSTAITGENGAGKTTIIEAIAWALFDTLDYKKVDFVQRGARKGSVRVSFVSSLDEREYTVYRDTGTAYYVHAFAGRFSGDIVPGYNGRVNDRRKRTSLGDRRHRNHLASVQH